MAGSEPHGYSVTLEVFVPLDVTERAVRRLDEQWQIEDWTPTAAAFQVANEALESAGLHGAVNQGVREVLP